MDTQERRNALQRARRGDVQALGMLLESFRPYLRAVLQHFPGEAVQSQADVSDLIQDALLEVHKSFADFRGTTVAEFVVWLRRIAQRTGGRSVRRLVPAASLDAGATVDAPAAPGSSPSARAAREEQEARITEALARLPEDMQQVLIARHVDGLPYAAIAGHMGRSEGAARVLYVRALGRLRELYRPE